MKDEDFYELLDNLDAVIKNSGLEYCNPMSDCPCVTIRSCRFLVCLPALRLCERKRVMNGCK